ncbi:hypothetical protein MRB53_036939 [Persea americana]|nr:hypothetical protein MRB53_036939 [Persea americana]
MDCFVHVKAAENSSHETKDRSVLPWSSPLSHLLDTARQLLSDVADRLPVLVRWEAPGERVRGSSNYQCCLERILIPSSSSRWRSHLLQEPILQLEKPGGIVMGAVAMNHCAKHSFSSAGFRCPIFHCASAERIAMAQAFRC